MPKNPNSAEPLHILVLPTWYPNNRRPDYAVFFRVQTAALLRNGAKVGVIFPELREVADRVSLASALENRFSISVEQDSGYPVIRWRGWRIPKLHKVSALFFRLASFALYRRYVRLFGKPDIILAHAAVNAGWAAAKLSAAFDLPFVIVEHSTHFARGLYDNSALKRASYGFSNADKVFAVSEPFANLLSEKFQTNVAYAPNSIDTDFFCPDETERTEPLSSGRSLRLAFVGTLDSKKGVDVLIKAIAALNEKNEKVDLRMVGEGTDEAQYKEMAKNAGLENSISFLGHKRQKDVRELMRWADIFILPSRFETFGVVLIEALATGTPVISTLSGGPESIVTSDDLGLLVPVGDSDALASAILKEKQNLLGPVQEVAERSRRIHQNVEERFSADARAQAMLKELAALTKGEMR